MKSICTLFLIFVFSCNEKTEPSAIKAVDFKKEKAEISKVLDKLNEAAAQAKFEDYFSLYADDAIFIGTDATEKWHKQAFKAYAKPHFDKGKAWTFRMIKREIFISKDGQMAWFDELLDTRMKICRGSGVLTKIDNQWKISQYVLSMTVPNDNADEVIKIKAPIENSQLENIKKGG